MTTKTQIQTSASRTNSLARRLQLIFAVLVVSAVSSLANAAGALLVVGPVESVDVPNASAVVLGQRVNFTSASRVAIGSTNGSSAVLPMSMRSFRFIELGRMVAIWSEDGITASEIYVSRDRSVPGASQIYLNGAVSFVNQSTGFAVVGTARIDLTPALSGGLVDIAVGDRLQVVGTQPNPNGVVVATVYSATRTSGIGGTSTNGIGGTSINGIGGTSVSGIGGTSTSGIGGTSTNGIGGTSVSGIGGTSTSGIGGTSTSGIGGTSTSGIGGTSTNGIGGTSTSGIGGTSTNGIGGTSTK